MARLVNRVALVFGAGSSGSGVSNGKAACLAYAREGARVVAVDVNNAALDNTTRDVIAQGGQCTALLADVRSAKDVEGVIAQAVKQLGAIDILHNNVGIFLMGGPEELSVTDWNTTMEVNVRGAFLACKYTLPIMVAQKRGVIINTSSIAGQRWCGGPMVGYSASKAAINQLTSEIAVQYAPHGIRCNAVVPGIISTPLMIDAYKGKEGGFEEVIKARSTVIPMGRLGSAWDVANAAVFLASDEASYITGAHLPVDGGLACKSY